MPAARKARKQFSKTPSPYTFSSLRFYVLHVPTLSACAPPFAFLPHLALQVDCPGGYSVNPLQQHN